MKTKVLQYTNYRDFLRDWSQEKKETSRTFSLRSFARKAGISSPNYFQRVIQSDLKLTDTMIEKFIAGVGLQGREAEYFRALVRFNQAEDAGSKVEYLRMLDKASAHSEIRALQSRNLQKDWYYQIIWELASCKDFELTPANVTQALGQSVTKREAKEAIQFLESAGYLLRQPGTNRFTQPPIQVTTPDEVANPCVQLAHKKFSQISETKLSLPVSEREYQGIIIALSPERLKLAKQMIKKITEELLTSLAQDTEADRVYRINLQLFPVTETSEEKSTHAQKNEGVMTHANA